MEDLPDDLDPVSAACLLLAMDVPAAPQATKGQPEQRPLDTDGRWLTAATTLQPYRTPMSVLRTVLAQSRGLHSVHSDSRTLLSGMLIGPAGPLADRLIGDH